LTNFYPIKIVLIKIVIKNKSQLDDKAKGYTKLLIDIQHHHIILHGT